MSPLTPEHRGLCRGRAGSGLASPGGPGTPRTPRTGDLGDEEVPVLGPAPGAAEPVRVASCALSAEIPFVWVRTFIQRCFLVFKGEEAPWREKGATIW